MLGVVKGKKGHKRANIVRHSPDSGCKILGSRRLLVSRIQAIHSMNYVSLHVGS